MAGIETTRPLRGVDPVESLNRRIHQLSGQLADVHGELAAVRKRVESYATFDKSIQDAVTSALRTAHEIRTHAEESAATLATEAGAERDRIFSEIAKLDRERQTLAVTVRPAAPHAPATAEGRRTSPRAAGAVPLGADPRPRDLPQCRDLPLLRRLLVARIAQPRLTVLGSADATLELRLEGEVSVA